MFTQRSKLGIAGMAGLVLLSLAFSGCQRINQALIPGAWSAPYVENRWSLPTPIPGIGPYWREFGWDPTGRFYAAVSDERGANINITIVDRLHARWCTLGTANWTQAQFDTGSYGVYVWNQYGWNATTSLNLETWEVTMTIRGSCFQWMSCQRLDPPQVIGPEYCDPDQVYGPGGLS